MKNSRKQPRRPAQGEGAPRRFVALAVSGVMLLLALGVGAILLSRPPAIRIERILAAYREDAKPGGVTIQYPLNGTLFPPEIIPPTFRWESRHPEVNLWLATTDFSDGGQRLTTLCSDTEWTPSESEWSEIKRRSLDREAKVTVLGVDRARQDAILAAASVSIGTSPDEVGAPIFYREVALPFIEAVKDPAKHIRWRFGSISSVEQPPVVLEKLPVCANCHSFSADGATLGMDVDYANDQGAYIVRPVEKEMALRKDQIITWSDFRREDRERTFGLLSQVSPDGRYVVSTVKDRSVFVPRPDLAFSQLFFPIQGILAVYDRQTRKFFSLPGADDKELVQSNPTWSPDGQHIVFARAKAHRLKKLRDNRRVLLSPDECPEFIREGGTFQFDLYRIPFNGGRGGKAQPLAGASHNGLSNYFAKYSPDGKWIVFCQAKSFMLLQPDSQLHIIPAQGGESRRLRCNTNQMNSWHSWSPNGKWLVFSSKANSAYTQLFLTHVDGAGNSTPPVLLRQFTAVDRAANIPEFVHTRAEAIRNMRAEFVDEQSYLKAGGENAYNGDYDLAEQAFQKALEINPRSAAAYESWGVALVRQKKPAEAIERLSKAIELRPASKYAHYFLGQALANLRRTREAIEHTREAVRLDPAYAEARVQLGTLLVDSRDGDEGRRHLAEAARLEPRNPQPRVLLGVALAREGKAEEAVVWFRRALEADANSVESLLWLASLLGTNKYPQLRNSEEAIRLATKACELTHHRDPAALTALADACAEAGRRKEALQAAATALPLAQSVGNQRLAQDLEERIRQWRQAAH